MSDHLIQLNNKIHLRDKQLKYINQLIELLLGQEPDEETEEHKTYTNYKERQKQIMEWKE